MAKKHYRVLAGCVLALCLQGCTTMFTASVVSNEPAELLQANVADCLSSLGFKHVGLFQPEDWGSSPVGGPRYDWFQKGAHIVVTFAGQTCGIAAYTSSRNVSELESKTNAIVDCLISADPTLDITVQSYDYFPIT